MTALERAARALYEMGRPASATAEHWNLEWSEIGEGSRNEHREQARAVLMAVREPDDDVWEAGNEALSMNGLYSVEGDDSTVCFTAMIDAILNEKDTTND